MAPKAKKENLDDLLFKRANLESSILRMKTSICNVSSYENSCELECRFELLKSYIDQALNCQTKIEVCDPIDSFRGTLEELCITTKALYMSAMKKGNESCTVMDMSFASSHRSRLPKMSLPKFTGKHAEFKSFLSLFESLVDADSSLPTIEKFNHLISCLSGDALGTVKAFQISEANYPKALASLKRVYDNKCLIFFDNISKLFDLSNISKPSSSALRTMIDTVSAIYDLLLSQGDDKQITNAIIIHLVMTKVDNITRSKWEEQMNYDELPLWKDCELALNRRFQHISAEEDSTSKIQKITKNKIESYSKNNSNFNF